MLLLGVLTVGGRDFLPQTLRQEWIFAHSLFGERNDDFDRRLIEVLSKRFNAVSMVRFNQITFVFKYPTTNGILPAFNEMAPSPNLVCGAGACSRKTGDTNEIPINYIRLHDAGRTGVFAEVELLITVHHNVPLKTNFVREFFGYAFNGTWTNIPGYQP